MLAVVEFGLGWVVDTGLHQPTGPPVCPRIIVLSFRSSSGHVMRGSGQFELGESTQEVRREVGLDVGGG